MSSFLSSHLRIFDFWVRSFLLIVLFSKDLNFVLLPVASLQDSEWSAQVSLPCPSSSLPGLTRYSKFCEGFSLALHGLRDTQLMGLAPAGTLVSVSPSVNLHWKLLLDLPRDMCPSMKQSGLSFLSHCASRITSFLLVTFSICHAGVVSSFFHSLSTAAFASGIFIA